MPSPLTPAKDQRQPVSHSPAIPVWGDKQWRAMSSPLRYELAIVAGIIAPTTAQELAEATGRTRASVYPHLQALVDAGFLKVIGHRPSERRPVAIYDRGPMYGTRPYDTRIFDRAREWSTASRGFFRMHAREQEAAVRSMEGSSTLVNGIDVHHLFGKIMHLDRDGMTELVRLQQELRTFARKHAKPQPGTEIIRLMVSIVPDQRTPTLLAASKRRKAVARASSRNSATR